MYYNDYDPDMVEMQGLPQTGQAQGWESANSPPQGQAAILQPTSGPADFGPLTALLVVVGGIFALRLWVHFAPDGD